MPSEWDYHSHSWGHLMSASLRHTRRSRRSFDRVATRRISLASGILVPTRPSVPTPTASIASLDCVAEASVHSRSVVVR